jgi:REP element-mobilizing transposase RayT
MGYRLSGFDYTRPFFYMVTLKRLPGLRPLSEIVAPGRCRMNAVTRAMVNAFRNFHRECPGVAPVERFTIMPDHVHALVRIVEDGERPSLLAVVPRLAAVLGGRYSEVTGEAGEVFDPDWHDWIVKKEGQLETFAHYIRDNPHRAWLRRENRRFFTRLGTLSFAGREWFAYGNPALLELPVLEPFRCSRSWAEGGSEWQEAIACASRIGPGGAGVGTFLSPCEKACGNAIFKAGGSFVVLAPEGFPDRWHPGRAKEALCAEGRMLFLSLWLPQSSRPDNATLHRRCHEMGDLILCAQN